MVARIIRVWVSVCVLLVWGSLHASPLVSAFATPIHCCGTKRSCCCKKHRNIGDRIAATSECAQQCGGGVLLQSSKAPAIAPATSAFTAAPAEALPRLARLDDACVRVPLVRYQRPPPFLS